jgi:hypothetical protein
VFLLSHVSFTNIVNELGQLIETAAVACTDARVRVCGQFLGSAEMWLACWRVWLRLHPHIDSLAEWSKALAPGASP